MKPILLLASALLVLPLSGCSSLKLRECGLSTAVGAAGGGTLGALFAADVVAGDSTSAGERAGAGAVGAVLGAAAGNLYCQRAIRQRQDLEDRLRIVIAEEMAASAATSDGGGGGTGGGGGDTIEEVAPAPEVDVVDGRGVRLELGDALVFAPGGDRLAASSNPYLDAVAASLVETPSSQIAVVGHTDGVGDADANLGLSERRAAAVAGYLESRGVDAARLKSVGKGETEPLVEDTSAEARAKNRRVEIYILPTA